MILIDVCKNILEDKLNISCFLNEEEQNVFCKQIYSYIYPRIMTNTILISYLDETITFLQKLDFSHEDIISTLYNSPSLLQANKRDMLSKYLMLSPIVDSNGKKIRKDIMINSPKHLVRSASSIYARIIYLLNIGLSSITKWYVLKMTNKEFEERFHITNDELMKMYPYDDSKINELLEWPGNEEIKEKITQSRVGDYHA